MLRLSLDMYSQIHATVSFHLSYKVSFSVLSDMVSKLLATSAKTPYFLISIGMTLTVSLFIFFSDEALRHALVC